MVGTILRRKTHQGGIFPRVISWGGILLGATLGGESTGGAILQGSILQSKIFCEQLMRSIHPGAIFQEAILLVPFKFAFVSEFFFFSAKQYALWGKKCQGKFSSGKNLVTSEKLVTFPRLIFQIRHFSTTNF